MNYRLSNEQPFFALKGRSSNEMPPDIYLDMLICAGKIESLSAAPFVEIEKPYLLTLRNNSSAKVEVTIFGYSAGHRWSERMLVAGKSSRTRPYPSGQFAIACFDPDIGKLLAVQALRMDYADEQIEIKADEKRPELVLKVSLIRVKTQCDSSVEWLGQLRLNEKATQVGQVPGWPMCLPNEGLTGEV